MNKNEYLQRTLWLDFAAQRAEIVLAPYGELPESASELVYWEAYLKRLKDTSIQSCCASLGIKIGQEVRIAELKPHGSIFINAAESLEHFLKIFCQHSQQNNSVSEFHLEQVRGGGRLVFHPSIAFDVSQVEVDIALSAVVQLLRAYLGKNWQPAHVGFTTLTPIDLVPYNDYFGRSISFKCHDNYIDIDEVHLQRTIEELDPFLKKMMQDSVNKMLSVAKEPQKDLSAQVKFIIMDNLASGQLSQEDMAKKLNVSRATLQRKLSNQGTSFRQLKNEVISHIAKQSLTESDASISIVSDNLGFSESAAFIRSFNALEGMTPNAYRKKMQK